jgi:hypothetical protein
LPNAYFQSGTASSSALAGFLSTGSDITLPLAAELPKGTAGRLIADRGDLATVISGAKLNRYGARKADPDRQPERCSDMIPNRILGVPIVVEAAPSDFVAAEDRELYSQIQRALDALRCPECGSLNYSTRLFVFSDSIEKRTECHVCGNVETETLPGNAPGLLSFLSQIVAA